MSFRRSNEIPMPPNRHIMMAGHHWLVEVDYDGRENGVRVLQWNPSAKQWSNSGMVGTGIYVDTAGWRYLQHCEVPEWF